jgi:hypothetical protein
VVDGLQMISPVDDGSSVVQTFVFLTSVDHVSGRWPEVIGWVLIKALTLVASMVYSLGPPMLLQRGVREGRPALSRVLDPDATVEGPALQRTATFGMRRIGSAKPRFPGPINSIVPTFRNHQVRVGVVLVVPCVATRMDRQGVRQMFLIRQFVGERLRDGDLAIGVEITRQGEIRTDVKTPVLSLVQICTVPVPP